MSDTYSDNIMRNQFDLLTEEELTQILITHDGRGTKNKQKALDILLQKAYDRGHDNLRSAIEGVIP